MNETWKIIFGMCGGLALFLYGMNLMSDSLQKAAGEKMKSILGFLTKNPVMGALAGALVTAILQSSSATTVMVIGFVSAGLMSLPQAISVIFGANIGTTMTAQLLAFKISDYIYPIIFIGFLIQLFAKKEKVRNIGMVILAFGVLFEGIEIMSGVMKPLAAAPFFVDMMGKVKDIPVLGVILGAGMTLVVQSSSATIAVLQNFAQQAGPDGVHSVIGLAGAIPILLGDNIGTTITAILASLTQNRNSKRVAIAHTAFNVSGAVLFLLILKPFASVVAAISPKGPELSIISRQIANAHTFFNVAMTLIWLPLIPLMVKFVRKVIPHGASETIADSAPMYLDEGMLSQPVPALYLTFNEITRYASQVRETLVTAEKELFEEQKEFDERIANERELRDKISGYITRMIAGGVLAEDQVRYAAGFLDITNCVDRVSDRTESIVHTIRKLSSTEKGLSASAKQELKECFEVAIREFGISMDAFVTADKEKARTITREREKMDNAQKRFLSAHFARVKSGICDASLTGRYSKILYNMDRITDHCVGISDEVKENADAIASLKETMEVK